MVLNHIMRPGVLEESYRSRLPITKEKAPDDPRNFESFEVIPYELLWDLILKN